jgi:hypothetical protein
VTFAAAADECKLVKKRNREQNRPPVGFSIVSDNSHAFFRSLRRGTANKTEAREAGNEQLGMSNEQWKTLAERH